jgi:hypothetical protein
VASEAQFHDPFTKSFVHERPKLSLFTFVVHESFVNMAADHRSDGAREELRASSRWKAYITTHFAAQAAGSAAGAKKDFVHGAMLSDDDDATTTSAATTAAAGGG